MADFDTIAQDDNTSDVFLEMIMIKITMNVQFWGHHHSEEGLWGLLIVDVAEIFRLSYCK